MKNFRKFDSTHKIKHLDESLRNFQSLHSSKSRAILENGKKIGNTLRNVPIYLFYKKNKIICKVQYGLPYSKLVEKLYEELLLLEYQKCECWDQATKNIQKVIGFSTQCKNLKEDYLLSKMKGKVTRSLLLECFMANKKNKNNILNYEIYNCLAIGGFSKVYLTRSKENGQFYALKLIKKKNKPDNSDHASTIINEMKICENLEHPFLVKLVEGFETENFYCMVFQYCPGGELFFLLKRLKCMNEESAKFYFIQILLAIEFLHSNLILYRDLKPQNILIDWEGNTKLVDFGLSKKINTERQKTYSYCGSAEYMAPEMILRCGHSFSIDHYSLGALLYELVTGLPPFYTKDPIALQESIINEEVNFPSHLNLSSEIKDLLTRLLIKNEKYRLGAYAGIKEIKFHPWIGKFNTDKIINKQAECPFPPNLYEHNFDMDELGEDEEEFTEQVFSELQTKKNGTIKLQIHCASKVSKKELRDLIWKVREKIGKDFQSQKSIHKKGMSKDQKENKENKVKSANHSLSKLSKKSFMKIKTNHQGCQSPAKESKIVEKLFPYFTKNTIKNKSPLKNSHRKKVFRIGVKQNKVQNSQDSVLPS